MEPIQRIVVGAEILRRCWPSNRSMEHPAQGRPINDAALNTKTNNATRELIHHDENPMGSQRRGFTSEQIAAPQTVLHVAEKREPGWTSRIRFWSVMNDQDTTNNILVDFDAESQSDLLGNSRAAPSGIAPFHFNDGVNEFLVWPFRTGLAAALWRKQQAILSLDEGMMEMQQRRGFQNDRRP